MESNPLDGLSISGNRLRQTRAVSRLEELAHKKAFLKTFACIGRIGEASKIIGISSSCHSRWMKTSAKYREAFGRAKMKYVECLEKAAHHRAVHGVRRLKFFKDEPIIDPITGNPYEEREYSDRLLIKLLEANDPEKYRPRSENSRPADPSVSVNVGVGVGINQGITVIQDDDWYGNASRAHGLPASADATHVEGSREPEAI